MFSFLIKRNFANAYKHVYNSLLVTLFGWVRGKVGLTEQSTLSTCTIYTLHNIQCTQNILYMYAMALLHSKSWTNAAQVCCIWYERTHLWVTFFKLFRIQVHNTRYKEMLFFFFIVNFFFFPLDIQAVNDGIFKYKHVFMSYFQMIFSMDFILLNAITSSNNQLVQFSARLLLLPLCYCCANAKYSVENMIHNLCDNYPITCMLHKRKLWDCESHISFVVNGAALTKRSFFIIEPFFFWICVENTYYTIFISYKTFHLSISLSGYFSVFRPCYFEILVRSCFHLVRMLVTAITA